MNIEIGLSKYLICQYLKGFPEINFETINLNDAIELIEVYEVVEMYSKPDENSRKIRTISSFYFNEDNKLICWLMSLR